MPNQHPWFEHPIGQALDYHNKRYAYIEKSDDKKEIFDFTIELNGFLNGDVNKKNIKSLNAYNYTVFVRSHTKNPNKVEEQELVILKNDNISPTLLTQEEIEILKKFVVFLETDRSKNFLKKQQIIAAIGLCALILFMICFILYLNYSSK